MGQFELEVKAIAEERFGSLAEFARVTNLNYYTLRSLLNKGNFATSRAETVTPIANALELDPEWLMRGKVVKRSARFKGFAEVPLFGSITADQPIDSSATDERFPIHKELVDRHPGAFLLRVSGTSMDRVLPDGSYALIAPCTQVEHSYQPYAVAVGTCNATVKRVRALENGLELIPDSTDPTYRKMLFDFGEDSTETVTVIGRVVTYYLPLNWRFE